MLYLQAEPQISNILRIEGGKNPLWTSWSFQYNGQSIFLRVLLVLSGGQLNQDRVSSVMLDHIYFLLLR